MLLGRGSWFSCSHVAPEHASTILIAFQIAHRPSDFAASREFHTWFNAAFWSRATEADKPSKLVALRWCIANRYAHDAQLAEVEGDATSPAWCVAL